VFGSETHGNVCVFAGANVGFYMVLGKWKTVKLLVQNIPNARKGVLNKT
jgi:hypothetical protein